MNINVHQRYCAVPGVLKYQAYPPSCTLSIWRNGFVESKSIIHVLPKFCLMWRLKNSNAGYYTSQLYSEVS